MQRSYLSPYAIADEMSHRSVADAAGHISGSEQHLAPCLMQMPMPEWIVLAQMSGQTHMLTDHHDQTALALGAALGRASPAFLPFEPVDCKKGNE